MTRPADTTLRDGDARAIGGGSPGNQRDKEHREKRTEP
jgi:hypothetical protein